MSDTQTTRRRGTNMMVDSDHPMATIPEEGSIRKVQTPYTTAIAVQQPRTLAEVQRRGIEEATLLGEDGFYAWGEGKNHVEGPSKHLAMALVRCFGNCAVDLGEVQETGDAWIFTATFVDLETGFTLARQFRQSKVWTVFGKLDDARKEDVRFQIGQTKAVRNVVLNAMPQWLTRRMMDACKGGVRERIEKAIEEFGLEKVQQKAISSLNGLGAPTENVLAYMGKKNVASLTVEDLVLLSGCKAALESRQETPEAMFPAPVVSDSPATPNAAPRRADALADALAGSAGTLTPAPTPETPKPAEAAQQASGDAGRVQPDLLPSDTRAETKGRRR